MDEVPSHARGRTANRVKNKAPAKLQITAEQLLREAWERKDSVASALPKIQIADHEELLEYQRNERKQYEMRIVRNRSHTALWIRYARWEEDQEEFVRARSIWERAIDNDYRNPAIWLNYAEMEMRHRFINHARNVLDRAVALLPRSDQLWLKYAHMEEMLNQLNLARLVYQRWLKWFPETTAYFAFVRFELRHGETDNARGVYNQLLFAHRTAHSYIKFAKFEERHDEVARARQIYERASQELPKTQLTPSLFLSFAKFEERRKQTDRARAIYKFAIATFAEDARNDLDRAYTNFEKQQGDREALNEGLVSSRRAEYQAKLASEPYDYDTWFDWVQMEQSSSTQDRTRAAFEKAVSSVPPVTSKPAWSKYIFLWISYAVWTELSCADLSGAIQIYKRCVAIIPHNHRKFSFGNLWLLYAQAEIRRKDIGAARRILGTGIGVLPDNHDLYRAYIELETALGEVERARKLYTTWLTRHPTHSAAFLMLARMEMELGEMKRARYILEVATSVEGLDDAMSIWMSLADLLAKSELKEQAIQSFESHVGKAASGMIWTAYISLLEKLQSPPDLIRRAYERSLRSLKEKAVSDPSKSSQLREEAFEMGQKWLIWETGLQKEDSEWYSKESLDHVHNLIPQRVQRNSRLEQEVDEAQMGWDIVFPEENVSTGNASTKLIDAARRWKLKTAANVC